MGKWVKANKRLPKTERPVAIYYRHYGQDEFGVGSYRANEKRWMINDKYIGRYDPNHQVLFWWRLSKRPKPMQKPPVPELTGTVNWVTGSSGHLPPREGPYLVAIRTRDGRTYTAQYEYMEDETFQAYDPVGGYVLRAEVGNEKADRQVMYWGAMPEYPKGESET